MRGEIGELGRLQIIPRQEVTMEGVWHRNGDGIFILERDLRCLACKQWGREDSEVGEAQWNGRTYSLLKTYK